MRGLIQKKHGKFKPKYFQFILKINVKTEKGQKQEMRKMQNKIPAKIKPRYRGKMSIYQKSDCQTLNKKKKSSSVFHDVFHRTNLF